MLLCAPTIKKTNENSQVYAGFSWNFHRNGGTFKPVPSMERTIKFFFGTTQYSEHCWKEWIGDFYCDTVDVSNKWNARVVPSIYFELEIQLFKGLMISSLNSDHPFHSCCVCTRYFTSTFLLSALSVTNDEMAVVISMVGEQH